MSAVSVSLTVTFDHEPGHMLEPEDLVLRIVQDAFDDAYGSGVTIVVVDDVNVRVLGEGRRHQ
jgi:hypothetical protein